jgi:hypothetical protein
MKGDFTRSTFNRKKHYRRVNMQQGRVQLDADWNEQAAIDEHHLKSLVQNIVGKTGTPIDPETGKYEGFKVTSIDNPNLFSINKGLYYVDGLLCENENDVRMDKQPDLPTFQLTPEQKTAATLDQEDVWYIVYLDVWKRHLTYLDDPQIRETALLGPDTATRTKIVWQVKAQPFTVAVPAEAPKPAEVLAGWTKIVAPSTGMLAARAIPMQQTATSCELPPKAGYAGIENHLYRVEINDVAVSAKGPTFKWSKDNGVVVSRILGIDEANHKLTVSSAGKDAYLGFTKPCWAEVTSDKHDLWGIPGVFLKIIDIDEDTLTFDYRVSRANEVTNANFPSETNPKIRRWDCDPDQAEPCQTAAPGSSEEGYLTLKDQGVQIRFNNGSYRTGNYWLIPARSTSGDIEWPSYAFNWRDVVKNGAESEKLSNFLKEQLEITPALKQKIDPALLRYLKISSQILVGYEFTTDLVKVALSLDASGEKATLSLVKSKVVPLSEIKGKDDVALVKYLKEKSETDPEVALEAGLDLKIRKEAENVFALFDGKTNAVQQYVLVDEKNGKAAILYLKGKTAMFEFEAAQKDDGSVQLMWRSVPPEGVKHHYACLALVYVSKTAQPKIIDCRYSFPASTDLWSLSYVSGDGQCVQPDGTLASPLMASVTIGKTPMKARTVQFKLVAGKGTGALIPADGIVKTGTDGIAQCIWLPDMKMPRQQVEAFLVDDFGSRLGVPLYYNATLPTNFFYVEGDGQEVTLGQAVVLRVGVSIGKTPLDDAFVKFTIVMGAGNDTIASSPQNKASGLGGAIVVQTEKGFASAQLTINTTKTKTAGVKAELLNAKEPDDLANLAPVFFTVSTTSAKQPSATTGILELSGFNQNAPSHLLGPFKHFLQVSTPPSVMLGSCDAAGNNVNIEDLAIYRFGIKNREAGFKAVDVTESNFRVLVEFRENPLELVRLRWWATPAQEQVKQQGIEHPLNPTVTMTPTSGIVGTLVTVTGTNFTPNANITLTYDGNPVPNVAVKTNSDGAFSRTINVLSSPTGTHVLIASDGFVSASATFTVKPSITIQPPQGSLAAVVDVIGFGFSPNVKIDLRDEKAYKDNPIPTPDPIIKTNPIGEFKTSLKVPMTLITGKISAVDPANPAAATTAVATFKATATPKVTVGTNRRAGTNTTVTGTGFQPNTKVRVAVGKEATIEVSTDAAGNFTQEVQIPATAKGNYTFAVADFNGNELGKQTVRLTQ